MAKMFYRDDDGFYGSWIDEALIAATDPDDRAVIMNLFFDHRVPRLREAQFRKFCLETDGNLKIASADYHEAYIRDSLAPDFTIDKLNSSNRIQGRFKSDDGFVNVLDLNGLYFVVMNNQSKEDYPQLYFNFRGRYQDNPDLPYEYDQRLDANLKGKPIEDQKHFVGEFLRMLSDLVEAEKPRNPIWVAPWEEFKHYFGEPDDAARADRWQQALGLSLSKNRWKVLLHYTYEKLGGELFRPTQLDAGYSSWHFPSQVRRKVELGGQTMGWGDCARAVVPEYIHKQFRGLNEDNVLAIAKTMASKSEPLPACRRRHREALSTIDVDADDPAWYPADIIHPGDPT